MGSMEDWVNDKLHDIIGMSEKHVAEYLVALARKSSSQDVLVEKIKESGIDMDDKFVDFAKELYEKVAGHARYFLGRFVEIIIGMVSFDSGRYHILVLKSVSHEFRSKGL